MNVWYAIPSADAVKATHCLQQWKSRGYHTAVLLNAGSARVPPADLMLYENHYRGYPAAVNRLCREIKDAAIVITGGDDIFPDQKHSAQQLADEFIQHFPDTLGVMQPIGDVWMDHAASRVCGSPWMGKAFIQRANLGIGPFWEEYYHFYCDEELQEVAQKHGLLWQRPDLAQYHDHYFRKNQRPPRYLNKAFARWNIEKAIFARRKSAGFPGSELKACT